MGLPALGSLVTSEVRVDPTAIPKRWTQGVCGICPLQLADVLHTDLCLCLLSRYNPGCALSQVQPLEPWGNTVYGYST